jgi:hypothetical protein
VGFVDSFRSLLGGKTAANFAGPRAQSTTPAASNPFTRNLERDPSWATTLAPPTKNVPDDERIGAPGTIVRSGRIRFEEFNLELENEFGRGDGLGNQGVFDRMRKTDPQIRRSLVLLKYPLLSAKKKIEPGNKTELAREIADFVAYNLFELNDFAQITRETTLFYDFGFSMFEILKGQIDVPRGRFPNLPHAKGPGRPGIAETVKAICWTAIDLRHPKTIFQWGANPDRPTMLDFVVQRIAGSDVDEAGYRSIPCDRLLRFTHDQEAGNWAGVPVLRTAYKPWKIKQLLEEIDAIRHERMNVGVAKLTCPENPDVKELDKLEKILATLGSHQAGFLTLPHGYQFEFETSGQGEGTKVNEAIDRCTREIADNILAGFMTLGNGDTGSYAMADTQAGHHVDAIEVGAQLIEAVWNHGSDGKSFIKELVDLNYGPQDDYPKLRFWDLKSRDYGAIIELLPKLMASGVMKSDLALRNFIRDRLDLPPEGEIDVLENQEDVEDAELEAEDQPAPEEAMPAMDPNMPADPKALPPANKPALKPAPVAPATVNGGQR